MPVAEPQTSAGTEARLVGALREGDPTAFESLVDRYSPAMLRVATMYAGTRAVAEEVVQETWLAVLQGVENFEGRSSLRTWIFKILTNIASTRGARERRSTPFSCFGDENGSAEGPAVDPDRFLGEDHHLAGHWAIAPTAWPTPEAGLLQGETREVILAAIERLPEAQRIVVSLRDIYGWPAGEVCTALEISEGNQRVLLHRARSKLRGAIERHLGATEVLAEAAETEA
jgi:RNA polymerase sigma-70 factor, ECF subfamily